MSTTVSQRLAWLIPLALLFAAYVSTAHPIISLGDGGELVAAVHALGIPHNSGYPAFGLAGKVFALIPLGNIGFRVNLMSCLFGVLTVGLTFGVIRSFTGSVAASISGALVLGASPLLWSQAVAAEVYTLHTFFVVLLTLMLRQWDRDRAFYRLVLFALVTGVSFTNHLQTVMLAPAVFCLVLVRDRRALLSGRRFLALSLIFCIPLLTYLYLPVRTLAGTAVAWGEPDTLSRFLAHVTASSHRSGYVFDLSWQEALTRLWKIAALQWDQFGVLLVLAFWGWWQGFKARWRAYFALLIGMDLFYTVYLNTIALEVTAFTLPTCIAVSILIGGGMHDLISRASRFPRISGSVKRAVPAACALVPAILFVTRISYCDQSLNYTGYEHALNIFRTPSPGGTVLVDSDNNFFPMVYGRIVEGMREDVTVYDRHNILFKMPYLGDRNEPIHGTWEELKEVLEREIVRKRADSGLYYAVFDPTNLPVPEPYAFVPEGVLHRVVHTRGSSSAKVINPWPRYAMESYYEAFQRDYHNRQVVSNTFCQLGRFLMATGKREPGLTALERASQIGYDDTGIHFLLSAVYAKHGEDARAREELRKASLYSEHPSLVHNAWGVYFLQKGAFEKAERAFQRAVSSKPRNPALHRNLGLALMKEGKEREAMQAFCRSLRLRGGQRDVEALLRAYDVECPE